MRCMSRSAILLKVCLVNLVFFQLCKECVHNIVTVPLGVESLREKNWSDYTRPSNPNTNLLIMQRRLVEVLRAFLYCNRQVRWDFLIILYINCK
jgi:hypothetical protein